MSATEEDPEQTEAQSADSPSALEDAPQVTHPLVAAAVQAADGLSELVSQAIETRERAEEYTSSALERLAAALEATREAVRIASVHEQEKARALEQAKTEASQAKDARDVAEEEIERARQALSAAEQEEREDSGGGDEASRERLKAARAGLAGAVTELNAAKAAVEIASFTAVQASTKARAALDAPTSEAASGPPSEGPQDLVKLEEDLEKARAREIVALDRLEQADGRVNEVRRVVENAKATWDETFLAVEKGEADPPEEAAAQETLNKAAKTLDEAMGEAEKAAEKKAKALERREQAERLLEGARQAPAPEAPGLDEDAARQQEKDAERRLVDAGKAYAAARREKQDAEEALQESIAGATSARDITGKQQAVERLGHAAESAVAWAKQTEVKLQEAEQAASGGYRDRETAARLLETLIALDQSAETLRPSAPPEPEEDLTETHVEETTRWNAGTKRFEGEALGDEGATQAIPVYEDEETDEHQVKDDAPPATFRLVVSMGDQIISDAEYDQEVVLFGRDPKTADVTLDNMLVSRRHAEIRRNEAFFALVDHGTANGTFLNGKKVQGMALLNEGDAIGIGKFRIKFHARAAGFTVDGLDKVEVEPTSDAGAGGMTIQLSPQAAKRVVEEHGRVRGYVCLPRDGPDLRLFVADTFQVGKHKGCDLLLKGWFRAPRKAAMVARGLDKYFLINVGPSETSVTVNDEAVADRVVLKDGDRIEVYGEAFGFAQTEEAE
jgi:pSer/pThr/pTyr-binding forkhead associated (FHA) protein